MRRDTYILSIAIVSGLLAFVLISQVLKEHSLPKTRVVVALGDLKAQQNISANDVALSSPADYKSTDPYFLNPKDVVGKLVLNNISKGSPVRREEVGEAPVKVAEVEVPPEEPLPIPPGMRAVAIQTALLGSYPFDLAQGKYVDVIGYGSVFEGSNEKDMQTLIRGAQVIAVEKKEKQLASVTIAVTPDGALVAAKAMAQGKLSLVGRSEAGSADRSLAFEPVEIIRGVSKEKHASPSSQKGD